MRKTDLKKLLSGLLVMCMLFSMLPVSVFAEGTAGDTGPKATLEISLNYAGADVNLTESTIGKFSQELTYTINEDTWAYTLNNDTAITVFTLKPATDYGVPKDQTARRMTVNTGEGKDVTDRFTLVYSTSDATVQLRANQDIYDIRTDTGLIKFTVDFTDVFEGSTKYAINEVKIDGTARVGETLTALVDPEDATVDYQWYRGETEDDDAFEPIPDANEETYELTPDDEHKYIYVAVTGTGNYEGLEDASGTVYVAAENEKLKIDGVTISWEGESIAVDTTLTAEVRANGSVMSNADDNVTYQWEIGNDEDGYDPIEDATEASYTVDESDIAKYIRIVVEATENNDTYEGDITSDPVGPVVGKLTNEEQKVDVTIEDVKAGEETVAKDDDAIKDEFGEDAEEIIAALESTEVEVSEEMASAMEKTLTSKLMAYFNNRASIVAKFATLHTDIDIPEGAEIHLSSKTEMKAEPVKTAMTDRYIVDIAPKMEIYISVDGTDINDVLLESEDFTDTLDEAVEVVIGVPDKLATQFAGLEQVYVKHRNDNGLWDYSESTKTVLCETKNFSEFTVSAQRISDTRPGGGVGGGGGAASSTVNVGSTSNGTVTVNPKNAKKGDTVTITAKPDSGYVVGSVTVTDSNGKAVTVTLNADGTCSFVMPEAVPVTIKVEFVKETAPAVSNPFYDVVSGAYYYDAVLWAIENNITAGMTATSFGPNEPCTRAQIVTFLWRAAGSPKATGSNPFTDVSASEYYYDAVLWAVANGITAGTTATTFSPTSTCTRAQAVSFIYRANNSPAVSGTNSFTDLASGAYYTSAVQWAVANGITAGTSNTTFSPDDTCTRAQIVSFLYRDMVG